MDQLVDNSKAQADDEPGTVTRVRGSVVDVEFARGQNAAMQSFFSENSTRFRTMEAAHQNIQIKSAELTKLMQRIRQDSVTTEILDLISGSEALASS